MGPVTYSFHYDEAEINAWLENEARMFEVIGNMYAEEMEKYMASLDAVTQEHNPALAAIDEMFKMQFDDMIYSASQLIGNNFTMT